jgi:hypothetical protein
MEARLYARLYPLDLHSLKRAQNTSMLQIDRYICPKSAKKNGDSPFLALPDIIEATDSALIAGDSSHEEKRNKTVETIPYLAPRLCSILLKQQIRICSRQTVHAADQGKN